MNQNQMDDLRTGVRVLDSPDVRKEPGTERGRHVNVQSGATTVQVLLFEDGSGTVLVSRDNEELLTARLREESIEPAVAWPPFSEIELYGSVDVLDVLA